MKKRAFRMTPSSRAFIVKTVSEVEDGWFVEVHRTATRSREQNDRMWSMLDDFAAQLPWRDWQGRTIRMTSDEWKDFFTAILTGAQRMVMNPEGTGMVLVRGRSTSDMKVAEMHDMQTLMEAFAAERGVKLRVHSEKIGDPT